MFDDLDKILTKRKTPDVPAHLSAQIIAVAARLDQGASIKRQRSGLLQKILGDIHDMLSIPNPAYAMAVVLIIGLFLGASGSLDAASMGMTTEELAGFMLIEDRFVASEFTGGEWS